MKKKNRRRKRAHTDNTIHAANLSDVIEKREMYEKNHRSEMYGKIHVFIII